jgi:serpin B
MLARTLILAGGLLLAGCKTQPAPGSTGSSASLLPALPLAPPSPGTRAALEVVALGDRDFAARLYARVSAQQGNLSFSPTSIRLALAMAYEGARGDTKAQMGRVLALDDGASAGFAALLTQWSVLAAPSPSGATGSEAERKPLVLRLANRLWGLRGRAFRSDFLGRLRDDYGAPLEELDFKGTTEASRNIINAWVAEQTDRKVQDLLGPESVTEDTRLVLTNAVYFKASWASGFSPAATQAEDFTTASARTVKAPMMRNVGYFPHAALMAGGVPCAALQLPYGAKGIAMVVLLPDAKDGLVKLEARIDSGFLDAATRGFATKRVDVAFPRFKTTGSLSLGDMLSAMGMPAAFARRKADFSAMDDTHELFLGAVVHQAFVSVDEKGTEAAAATAGVMERAGMPTDPPVPFHADHPFLFLIADLTNQTVLFMGRVIDPSV